jgi:hypothetical protein
VCALLVGLPNVIVLGIDDKDAAALRVHVETAFDRPVCGACGTAV